MRKLLKKMFYGLMLLFVLLVGLATFLLTTAPGLHSLIKLSTLFFPGNLKVHQLSGRALDEFTINELDYIHEKTIIKIKHLTVNWRLIALIHDQLPINSLYADSVEVKHDLFNGTLDDLKLTGELTPQQLKINFLSFNYLGQTINSQLQVDRQIPHALTGSLKLNPDSIIPFIKGNLSFGGDIKKIHWTGNFLGVADFSFDGSLSDLEHIIFKSKWRNLHWQKDLKTSFNSPEGSLNITGTLADLNIALIAKLNKTTQDNWQLAANIHGTAPWKWTIDGSLVQPLDPSSKHEGLYTKLSAKGQILDKNVGQILFTLAPGHYQMAKNSMIPALPFQGGTLKVSLSPQQLGGKGSIVLDDNKKLNIVFSLPKFELSKGLADKQPLSVNLDLIVNSFDFLKNLSPDFNNPAGQLTASLKTSGTLNKTKIESQFTLKHGSVFIPKLGLNLNDIDLTVIGKNQHWETEGTLVSANQKIVLKGNGPFGDSISGDLSLQGSDFPIMNTKEYQIKISPQLNVTFTPTSLSVTGSILVPFAEIKPLTFSNSIGLSEDVVLQNKAPDPASTFNTDLDLQVEMGKNVELIFKGLHATLAGKVNVKQSPHGPINAIGELTVVQGQYKAYGQDLAIEQGQLLFTGGRLDNPGINLRASKKIDTTTTSTTTINQNFDLTNTNLQTASVKGSFNVGVEVTGRLREPKILLFSNPATLSQADILSMMVLGRPASQANKAGGQLLLAAMSSMSLGNGTNETQLLEQLKKNLGFDINVQTTSNYNAVTNQMSDSTGVVVGKSLSKRIYVSYNMGLSQADPNVLTLKYLLNKFYSIQVSSSTIASGIDVLYTSSKKGYD